MCFDDDIMEEAECNSCAKWKDKKGKNDRACKGCACNQLKRLSPQTFVNVFTPANYWYCLRFISFDKKSCCAYFDYYGSSLVVDCQDINALEFPNYCSFYPTQPPMSPPQENRGKPQ
ncbi:hypothetical protein J2Z23_000015 [Lederbergia galactosidilyticus]|nr:hypothetical protein [Lederbergia galactosidilytica]